MDIRDFEGLTKFKVIVPTFYVCSWISMIIGPVLFPSLYMNICFFFVAYLSARTLLMIGTLIFVTIKSHQIFKRVQQPPSDSDNNRSHLDATGEQIYYGFILPNYKEDVQMMAQTLDILASHTRSKQRYLIFLAMEAHEQGSQHKATQLIGRYNDKFKVIDFTMHQCRQFEQKGKASNVSWCAEHLEPIFQKNMINPEGVMLTIFDADSWAPNVYFDIMEDHIIQNYENRHLYIYQPPQIFTRNNFDVPITTRVYDLMHSYAHCSNLFSFFNLTFPLSNYTLSYSLAKRIGFWDTCADAIGEDFHTTQKAFWKTHGQVKTYPIYAPFNQVNISTGNGYKEDVLARFWQAERHAQGVADVAYQFKMLLNNKFKPMNFIVFYQIFETFSLPGILPWIFISLMIQGSTLYHGMEKPDYLISDTTMSVLFNILTFGNAFGYILFEIMKRRANRLLYAQENQSIFRMLQFAIFFMINFFTISVPTFVFSAFMSVMGKREYQVAEKKLKAST